MNVSNVMADAFCTSIEKALTCPPDVETSVKRLRKRFIGLPDKPLYVSDDRGNITFHTLENGKQKYVSKKTNEIYVLARRRYQTYLVEALELTGSRRLCDIKRRQFLINKIQSFILSCSKGNLDIARIVLSSQQLKWFKGRFHQKYIDPNSPFKSAQGVPVRSKSERDITNGLDDQAVPHHYEEETIIYVKPLVDKLEAMLAGGSPKPICLFDERGAIRWLVPKELEWMNANGSIWKAYDPVSGTIAIFNDIIIMLADGTILIWEHEGMMDQFVYRCSASERASIMKYTGVVDRDCMIETFEHEVNTTEKIIDIIEREILPRLWF